MICRVVMRCCPSITSRVAITSVSELTGLPITIAEEVLPQWLQLLCTSDLLGVLPMLFEGINAIYNVLTKGLHLMRKRPDIPR